jgi:hypothetical protein
VTIPVANDLAFVGIPIHVQALLVQYPTHDWLTNVCRDVVAQ